MNLVILTGRLTKDPEYRESGETHVARYSLAVDRYKKDEADFPSCVVFGKGADFAKEYLKKGTKIAVTGHIQTGSYEKDGRKVYTTDVVVEKQEFCESRKAEPGKAPESAPEYMPNPADFVSASELNNLPFN